MKFKGHLKALKLYSEFTKLLNFNDWMSSSFSEKELLSIIIFVIWSKFTYSLKNQLCK